MSNEEDRDEITGCLVNMCLIALTIALFLIAVIIIKTLWKAAF